MPQLEVGLNPQSDETVLRQAEITVLRQMSDTIDRMGKAMQSMNDRLGAVSVDIARLQESDKQFAAVNVAIEQMRGQIITLMTERDQRTGAAKFAGMLKDFGPWIVGIVIGALAMAGIKLPHPA